jgi:hypothetical protein
MFGRKMATVKNDHIGPPLRLQRMKYPGGELPGKIPACVGDNPSQAFNRLGLGERPPFHIRFDVPFTVLTVVRIPSTR